MLYAKHAITHLTQCASDGTRLLLPTRRKHEEEEEFVFSFFFFVEEKHNFIISTCRYPKYEHKHFYVQRFSEMYFNLTAFHPLIFKIINFVMYRRFFFVFFFFFFLFVWPPNTHQYAFRILSISLKARHSTRISTVCIWFHCSFGKKIVNFQLNRIIWC